MKQKITLEIQNDTGVEFEEVAEWRTVREGEYFYSLNTREVTISPANMGGYPPAIVLTPKIDHELESAKKKFPVGSYFKTDYPDYDDFILPVTSVENRGGLGVNIWSGKNGNTSIPCPVERCTPFPLPTWRCCASDKPKKDGKYIGRRKNAPETYAGIEHFNNGSWDNLPWKECAMEWLDEGEL